MFASWQSYFLAFFLGHCYTSLHVSTASSYSVEEQKTGGRNVYHVSKQGLFIKNTLLCKVTSGQKFHSVNFKSNSECVSVILGTMLSG